MSTVDKFSINKCLELILLLKVVQVYISWPNTHNAPMRQLAGVKRQPMIAPAKVINVSKSSNYRLVHP